MIRLKYNSFDTDMGIQMMRTKNKANRRTENCFTVHIADLIPIFLCLYLYIRFCAFRSMPFTNSKLWLIAIALKRSPFSFCNWPKLESLSIGFEIIHLILGADCSTVSLTYVQHLLIQSSRYH